MLRAVLGLLVERKKWKIGPSFEKAIIRILGDVLQDSTIQPSLSSRFRVSRLRQRSLRPSYICIRGYAGNTLLSLSNHQEMQSHAYSQRDDAKLLNQAGLVLFLINLLVS